MMLGVHRPGISIAIGKFKNAGFLKYKRGRVVIMDRVQLEEASCECYGTIADEFDRLFQSKKLPRKDTRRTQGPSEPDDE